MSWRATIRRVEKRFADDPSVLGITRGVKIVAGTPTDVDAVVFLVARKQRRPRRPLPTYVHGVREDGSIDRSIRYPTDVRELREAAPRSSGRRIDRYLSQGAGRIEKGTIGLAFPAAPPPAVTLLSCSHVVADVWERRPLAAYRLKGWGDGRRRFVAVPTCRTRVTRRSGGFTLPFDAGIARVIANAAAVPCWSIPRIRRSLAGLYPGAIRLRMTLSVLGGTSPRAASGMVLATDFSTTLRYPFGGGHRPVRVSNLYELDGFAPLDGDSGAIVYRRAEAVGFVVGSFFDPGLGRHTAIFHRISSAAARLRRMRGGGAASALLPPDG